MSSKPGLVWSVRIFSLPILLSFAGASPSAGSAEVQLHASKHPKQSTINSIPAVSLAETGSTEQPRNAKFDTIGKAEVPTGPTVSQVSIVTPEVAKNIFKLLAGQTDIAFQYPEEGCYARAHKMALLLDERGIHSIKAYVEGQLRVKTPYAASGVVAWRYHVAPAIFVKEVSGVETIYIFDPTLFNSPVPLKQWCDFQIQLPTCGITKQFFGPKFKYDIDSKSFEKYNPDEIKDMIRTLKAQMKVQKSREGDPSWRSKKESSGS